MLSAAKRDHFSAACVWPAALIIWGPGSLVPPHSHHAFQLILALTGRLRVRPRRGARWSEGAAVFVTREAPHEVNARDVPVLMGFMDPESELAASLTRWGPSNIVVLPDATVERWRHMLGDPQSLDARRVETWVRSELLNESGARRIHPRVNRVLRHLQQQLPDPRYVSLARLSRIATLSPSRLMHVFTESLGVPLRPYLLWLRVQRAARAIASGSSATEAAHLAGFADAAHLTRTFRRTLGATPRELMAVLPSERELRVSSDEEAASAFKTA